ncbi:MULTISPECIES: c-type cytochrome biogenesis protein CcmI [Falsihalocynthiibacter]|uniref:c-type cytochrome biogenesis protein CcmI n=1 Tax=Falsihalocynthiibacter TaxID=2854182 RepID=UPI003002B918
MWFILTVLVLVGVCATFVVLNLMKREDRDSAPDAISPPSEEVVFYQRQLADIDRDVTSGTLAEEDASRTRTEVSRRLLDADKRAQNAPVSAHAPKGASYAVAALIVALLFGVGGYIYAELGGAGRADEPLAERFATANETYENRMSQREAEELAPDRSVKNISDADLDLLNKLRTALEQRPTDEVGHRLLAKQEAQLGNYTAARSAQTRVVELMGAEKVDTNDLILLARIMVYGANGFVSPEAEALWGEVMRREPQNAEARFYMGLMLAQTGRPDATYAFWEPLLERADPNAPWTDLLFAQFPDVAYFAGKDYTPPTVQTAGPTAQQMRDAGSMSEEDRQEMILGMVENLKGKLESGDGTAREWAQYIRANSVLGKNDVAKQAYDTAKATFADSPEDAQVIFQSGIEEGYEVGVTE